MNICNFVRRHKFTMEIRFSPITLSSLIRSQRYWYHSMQNLKLYQKQERHIHLESKQKFSFFWVASIVQQLEFYLRKIFSKILFWGVGYNLGQKSWKSEQDQFEPPIHFSWGWGLGLILKCMLYRGIVPSGPNRPYGLYTTICGIH